MNGTITPDLFDFELIVQHQDPVNLHVVQLAFARFQSAAVRANRSSAERLASLQLPNGLPSNSETSFLTFVELELSRNASRLLWLESVETGSSVFRGKVVNLAKDLFLLYLGAVASGVLERQDWHRGIVDAVDHASKEFVWQVVDYLNQSHPRSNNPDGSDIRAEIVGDRIRIIVHPRKANADMTYPLNPPPR